MRNKESKAFLFRENRNDCAVKYTSSNKCRTLKRFILSTVDWRILGVAREKNIKLKNMFTVGSVFCAIKNNTFSTFLLSTVLINSCR